MEQFNRRQFVSAMAALGLGGVCLPVLAQNAFPNRPVKLYVGASAGGAPDAAARSMAKLLGERWAYPMVVDNKPGLSGFLAAEVTAQSAPDGHSLCLLLDTVMNTVPLMSEKLPVDPLKDLKPIGMVGSFPLVLVANPSTGFRNLQQVVTAAKANAGAIDCASSGIGSSGHVATEMFARAAGVKLNHIPYKGGLPALQGTVAGEVPMMWSSVGAALPLVNGGKLIAIAVASAERFSLMPDVPTFHEQGYPNFTAGNWLGLMGPAALPEPLTQKIYGDVQSLATNDAYRQTLLAQGIERRSMQSPELSRLIRTEYERNKALFASLGIGPGK